MPDELLVAILAAGASRRLGRAKQLVLIDGEPLIRRQCRIAIECRVGPVTAIVGCHAQACAAAIADLPVTIRLNEQWQEGLASSVRRAIEAATNERAAAVLILHVDQYRVTVGDLQQLQSAWIGSGKTKACRARHDEYIGPPVILPASCFGKALTLGGEEGARGVLSALGPDALIDVSMPTAVHDLDIPAQLDKVNTSRSSVH